jgi:hypothetical protein
MANSPPSSVKSEPTGTFYSAHDQNLSYTSMYDTSIENTLPIHTGEIPAISSSIYIDAPVRPSNDTSFDLLQGYSAPTLPVYINMGSDRQRDDVTFAGPTTTDSQYSRSLVAMDVDHPLPPTVSQRHIHHHHHFPHHSQNRNRYPYLQRPISSKGLNRIQDSRSSLDGLPYYEQRPAFRRSYFALRRQRIPKGIEKQNYEEILFKTSSSFLAPPMPKHLFPGFIQNRPTASTNENGADENGDEDEGNYFKISLDLIRHWFVKKKS